MQHTLNLLGTEIEIKVYKYTQFNHMKYENFNADENYTLSQHFQMRIMIVVQGITWT